MDNVYIVGAGMIRFTKYADKRMKQLTNAFLKLSQVTQSELSRESINLSDMATIIAADLRQARPERRVKFVIEHDLKTRGDKRLLKVLMENLLGNAWKYTSKRPQARIEFGAMPASSCTDSKAAPQPAAVYYVRDDGAGFDMAHAGKLFGAFQRLHAQSEFEGTGVGLATVQRVIHRHGGNVWAEGAVDRGATFYFTLPASPNHQSPNHANR